MEIRSHSSCFLFNCVVPFMLLQDNNHFLLPGVAHEHITRACADHCMVLLQAVGTAFAGAINLFLHFVMSSFINVRVIKVKPTVQVHPQC